MSKIVNTVEVKRAEWKYGDKTYVNPEDAYRQAIKDCFSSLNSPEKDWKNILIDEIVECKETAEALYFVLREMLGRSS